MQNRDLNQRKQEISHSSWTNHRCSFFWVLSWPALWTLVSGQLATLRQGRGPWIMSLGTVHIGGGSLHPGTLLCIVEYVAPPLVSTLWCQKHPCPKLEQSEMPPAIAMCPTGVKGTCSGEPVIWKMWVLSPLSQFIVDCSKQAGALQRWVSVYFLFKVLKNDQESGFPRLVITSVVINFLKQPRQMSHYYLNPSAMADWFCSPIVSNFM